MTKKSPRRRRRRRTTTTKTPKTRPKRARPVVSSFHSEAPTLEDIALGPHPCWTDIVTVPPAKKRKTEPAAPEEVGDDEVDAPEGDEDDEEAEGDDDNVDEEDPEVTAKASGPGSAVKGEKKRVPKESNLDEVEKAIEEAEAD